MIYFYLIMGLTAIIFIIGSKELFKIISNTLEDLFEKKSHKRHLKKHLNFLLPILVGMLYLMSILLSQGKEIIQALFCINGFVSSGLFFGYFMIVYGFYNIIKHLEEERISFEEEYCDTEDCSEVKKGNEHVGNTI